MPIYEYKCPSCKYVFEEWVKGHDIEVPCTCPKCGADASHIVSNTTFVLKGGGWYVTEYGNRKPNGEGAASAPAPDSDSVDNGAESGAATATTGTEAAPAPAAGAAASDTKGACASTSSAPAKAPAPAPAPAANKAASAA